MSKTGCPSSDYRRWLRKHGADVADYPDYLFIHGVAISARGAWRKLVVIVTDTLRAVRGW